MTKGAKFNQLNLENCFIKIYMKWLITKIYFFIFPVVSEQPCRDGRQCKGRQFKIIIPGKLRWVYVLSNTLVTGKSRIVHNSNIFLGKSRIVDVNNISSKSIYLLIATTNVGFKDWLDRITMNLAELTTNANLK